MEPLKVLFASSEVEPFVKTGGLADVAGSLPRALCRNGLVVRVVMPKFKQIPAHYLERMAFLGHVEVDLVWRRQYCGIYRLEEKGVTCYFLDNEFYFHRDWYYGEGDDGERFAFFSRAILAFLPVIGFKPDILHLNDWQTGMTPVFLDAHFRWSRENGFYRDMRTVYTIHNLRYQGVFPKGMMDTVLGLDWSWFYHGGVAHNDCVNFMQGALNQSTRITTVSRTYAEEIRHPFFGEGLEGTIARRGTDLRGIVNGIDYEHNDPQTDTRLYATFSASDLTGKAVNKEHLQRQHHLPVRPDVPLVGIISRMVDQKGFDLVAHVLEELLREDVQVMVLGTGDAKYEELFRWAHHAYPRKMSAHIRYDGVLAQRMYAGCDMFLMPSLFEPCGLSQIFSMRYGTVPVVRETGGLKDTVVPYNRLTGEGTGFTFANYNAHEMLDALRRAFALFREPEQWENLVRACMRQDFSWDHAAREYEALYREIMTAFPDQPVVIPKPPRKRAARKTAADATVSVESVPAATRATSRTRKVSKAPAVKAASEATPVLAGEETDTSVPAGKQTRKPAVKKETAEKAGTKKEAAAKAGVKKETQAKPAQKKRETKKATGSPKRSAGTGTKGTPARNRKKDAAESLDRETLQTLSETPWQLLDDPN
jgi:starch synthase